MNHPHLSIALLGAAVIATGLIVAGVLQSHFEMKRMQAAVSSIGGSQDATRLSQISIEHNGVLAEHICRPSPLFSDGRFCYTSLSNTREIAWYESWLKPLGVSFGPTKDDFDEAERKLSDRIADALEVETPAHEHQRRPQEFEQHRPALAQSSDRFRCVSTSGWEFSSPLQEEADELCRSNTNRKGFRTMSSGGIPILDLASIQRALNHERSVQRKWALN